jgi:hypothetical protein
MANTLETLRTRMEAAARALDFEEAKRCRDQINMIRGGATEAEAEGADFAGLDRQRPGAMGLGSSQQRVTPPPGWQPPPKPDPMTSGHSRGGRPKA